MMMPIIARHALLHALPKNGVGAEIGVWQGAFSADLLRVAKPRRLHLIDPWRVGSGDKSAAWYGSSTKTQADMDAIHDRVRQKFAAQIREERVLIDRRPSGEALMSLASASLDWVYIDGDHTHEATLADLQTAMQKVRPGGLISGDDYGDRGRDWFRNGVTLALHEFLHETKGRTWLTFLMDGQFAIQNGAQ